MKTIGEIRDWLLENAVDNEGDLVLSDLDLSNFNGNVYIDYMKVKKSLFQDCQDVGENLHQDFQKVGKSLYQAFQNVGEEFYNHKLKKMSVGKKKEIVLLEERKLIITKKNLLIS